MSQLSVDQRTDQASTDRGTWRPTNWNYMDQFLFLGNRPCKDSRPTIGQHVGRVPADISAGTRTTISVDARPMDALSTHHPYS